MRKSADCACSRRLAVKMASPPSLGPRIALLRNARVLGQPNLVDVTITTDGLVGRIQPAAESTQLGGAGDATSLDAAGALVLPALLVPSASS